MSKNLKFIWVDDDPARETEAHNIEKRLNVSVDFQNVKNQNLSTVLETIKSGRKPDLIIMDHRLQDVESDLFKTGSTVAEIIREKWPVCPIVCVTAVEPKEIDSHKRFIYEDVFDISNISNYYLSLLSIAQSFKKLQSKKIENIEQLIRFLKVPKEDKEKLITILPDILKKGFSDTGLPLFIYKWARKTLIEKPGFLYDRLWAATLLGIKEESFHKVAEIFKKAKYTGIFADDNNERWWQSSLRKILSSTITDSDSIYPWALGRKLPGISPKDFSKCHVSGEEYPETVAFIDEESSSRAQMCLRYTIPHPGYEEALFFEEIRMMKAAE